MAKPTVIIVGADKGGVGKTTVARTLLDYLAAHRIPARAFDTEAPKGTFKRFHPDTTDIVDINLVPDQMKIFDTLNGADVPVTVIDVRAGLMAQTLRALRDFGFIEAARKGQITFAVFHVLGPTIASLDEIADTAAFLGDARYFLVKNFINNTNFFQWDEKTHSSYFQKVKDAIEITIPKLNEMATEQVELASVPFVTFVANKQQSGGAGGIFPSCCAAMSGTGSAMSGPNTTGSGSPTSWRRRASRSPRREPTGSGRRSSRAVSRRVGKIAGHHGRSLRGVAQFCPRDGTGSAVCRRIERLRVGTADPAWCNNRRLAAAFAHPTRAWLE